MSADRAEDSVALVATLSRDTMRQCDAALQAAGVLGVWRDGGARHATELLVAEKDAEVAVEALSALYADDLLGIEARAAEDSTALREDRPLLLDPAVASSLGLVGLWAVLYYVFPPGSAAWERAIVSREAVLSGQGWRLVTAALIHADLEHVAGNLFFGAVMGAAAALRLGPGVMVACWLGTAVFSLAASILPVDATSTLGASGGVFGLLGAAASHALRAQAVERIEVGFLRRRRALLGATLLVAMTAFGVRANITAHLTGFAAGLLVGLLMPRRPPRLVWQALSLLGALVVISTAVLVVRAAP